MSALSSFPGTPTTVAQITSGPVSVPASFLGIHANQYPGGTGPGSAAPQFVYGLLRLHDTRFGSWGGINTSSGVYYWGVIDQYMALGVPAIFTLYNTPTWAAKTADQAHTGPYGNAGECGAPNNIADLVTFLTALLTRYNTGGSHKIKYIEVWNEPNFYQNYTGFFWGTAPDMVAIANAVKTAIAAVDPTVKVLSPGFILTSAIPQFLSAQDPVSLKYGWQCIDEFAFHPYYAAPTYQSLLNPGSSFSTRLGDCRSALAPYGLQNIGLHASEWALGTGPSDDPVLGFPSRPFAERYTYYLRMLGVAAASGLRSFSLYMYGNALSGDLVADSAAISALNLFSASIPGKTIANATQNASGSSSGGQLTLTMSDGTAYIW